MDVDRLKITAETTAIRGRGWMRLLLRLAGIAIVLIGAGNLFGFGVWTGYHEWWSAAAIVGDQDIIVNAADIVAIGIGAAIAHFV